MIEHFFLNTKRSTQKGGEEDRCLHVALPVEAFLEMLTKYFNLRATAATRTGCARHGVGHHTPFSGRGSRNAAKGLRPNILQLNTEGLTEDKISVIEQLAQGHRQRGGAVVTAPHLFEICAPPFTFDLWSLHTSHTVFQKCGRLFWFLAPPLSNPGDGPELAYKNKAFIIVLQETHCTTADKLVIPNISLAGSFLSRGNAGVLNLFSPVYPLPAS